MSPEDFQHGLDTLRSYDDAVSLGTDCIQAHAHSNWSLGDLAARVAVLREDDPLLEEKQMTLRRFAFALGVKFDRIKILSAISHAVPLEIRSPRLTHEHYRVLVQQRFNREEIIMWAARAEDENWNASALAVHIKKAATAAQTKQQRDGLAAAMFLRRSKNKAIDVTALGARDLAARHSDEITEALTAIRRACDTIEAEHKRRRMKARRK